VQANRTARLLCAAWSHNKAKPRLDDPPGAWRTPPEVVTACLALRDRWRTLIRSNPDESGVQWRRRLVNPSVGELSVSITLISPATVGLAEPIFLLEFDRRGHGVAVGGLRPQGTRLEKLTPAEREVAMQLVEGLSNQEIATRLGKTIHAVKFLLHKIYENNHIHNRTGDHVAIGAAMRVGPSELAGIPKPGFPPFAGFAGRR
jgi:DNA-binding CsgD family transcriptional regulator